MAEIKEEKKNIKTDVESDFADAVVLDKKQDDKKEPVVEEKKPEVLLVKDDSEIKESNVLVPDTPNKLLDEVDVARDAFLKLYKKKSKLRTFVNISLLLVMLAGWILPAQFIKNEEQSNLILVIAIIVSAISLVGLGVYSHFSRKETDKGIREYFTIFYKNTFDFGFEKTKVENFNGNLDSKLDDSVFNESKLYKDIYKIGSRYFSTFKFKGFEGSICDCAAQCKGSKSLQTIFVGKYLTFENKYEGSGIYIYIKGGKRAIPPNNITSFPLIEDTKNYVIYGEKKEAKLLTQPIKRALNSIETNNVLVDVAISIQKGTTHLALGYEDTLMVIPVETKINAKPFYQFREDVRQFVDLAYLIANPRKEEK